MARVIITNELKTRIFKQFKNESIQILKHMKSLEERPHRGKTLASVSGIVIKEIKYENYRFYCVADGHALKFGSQEELEALIIKFLEMSDKKSQQDVIEKLKELLRSWDS